MEMQYSYKSSLSPRSNNIQQQWYPLPSFTAVLTNEPLRTEYNFTTFERWEMFEKLRNSEIIFFIIVSLKSGMENSIIHELNAEADRIIGNKLRVWKAEPVERSKTRMSIVQAVTSHVRFQNGNIEI